MSAIRAINFTEQVIFLAVYLVFVVWLARRLQPSPVSRWFLALTVALWLWVSGRFMESVVYLFLPSNNDAYVFAANFQYLGFGYSAASYVIWVLYVSGRWRATENLFVRAVVLGFPALIVLIVFTNPLHHLFYTKLAMGQQVGHGPLFAPLFVFGYVMLLAGWCVSMIDIVKRGGDKARRAFLLSAFPLLPPLAAAARSLSGIDLVDFTPVVMAVSWWCLYLAAFKHGYVNVVSSSLAEAVRHAPRPVAVYDAVRGEFVYRNLLADGEYGTAFSKLPNAVPMSEGSYEARLQGRELSVSVTVLSGGELMVSAADQTEVNSRLQMLAEQAERLEQLTVRLAEENRSIEAYLESLDLAGDLKRRKEMAEGIYEELSSVFERIRQNLQAARSDPDRSASPLEENLQIGIDSIAKVRAVVAELRG